jgi:hypothetical protein
MILLEICINSHGSQPPTNMPIGVRTVLPTKIPNLSLWLDASQLTGLSDGVAVSSWTDFSGNNNHAVQATAGNKPIYKTNQLNGKPSVQFTGSSNQFVTTPNIVLSSGWTFFVVNKPTLSVQQILISKQLNTPNFSCVFFYNAITTMRIQDSSDGTTTLNNIFAIPTALNLDLISIAYNDNTTNYIKDRSVIKSNPGVVSFNNGQGLSIGARNIPGSYLAFTGNIYEVVVYSRALTDYERGNIEQYLKYKWGI